MSGEQKQQDGKGKKEYGIGHLKFAEKKA